jgi:hypothetical protein
MCGRGQAGSGMSAATGEQRDGGLIPACLSLPRQPRLQKKVPRSLVQVRPLPSKPGLQAQE